MFLSMNHQILLHNSLTICLQLLGNLHHWLGHKGFHDLQKWAAEGINGIPSDVATCPIPMCHACQYGAAKKRSHETNNTGSVVGAPQGPKDFVSVDQMIAGSPGLIPYDSGRPSAQCYKSVTMWANHFSCYLHTQCHEQATIQSVLESKESFKLFAKHCNVWIKHIHSDNGVFMMKAFKDPHVACDQQQSFCGVGVHLQNGIIECYVGVITARACTIIYNGNFRTFAYI